MDDLPLSVPNFKPLHQVQVSLKHYSTVKKYRSLFDEYLDKDQVFTDIFYDVYSQAQIDYLDSLEEKKVKSQEEQRRKRFCRMEGQEDANEQMGSRNLIQDSSPFDSSSENISQSESKSKKLRKKKKKRKMIKKKKICDGKKGGDKQESGSSSSKSDKNKKFKINFEDFWQIHLLSKSLPKF